MVGATNPLTRVPAVTAGAIATVQWDAALKAVAKMHKAYPG